MINFESPFAGMAQHPISLKSHSFPRHMYRRSIAFAALATLLLLFAVGCNGSKGGAGVMATVNGRKIDRTEVDKYYKNQTPGTPKKPGEEQGDSLRLSILKELIDNEILMQRAEKLGLLA